MQKVNETDQQDQVNEATLGRCDFKQYEHCGAHEQIPDVGQRLPPFGCKNWKVNEEQPSAVPGAETKPSLELKAAPTCDDCSYNFSRHSPSVVKLCPFHAAAPELKVERDTLRHWMDRALREGRHGPMCDRARCVCWKAEARAALAKVKTT